ncbi:benzoate/H(+) symporter BenE family transporter [Actinocorallia longicatena]|uniref:Benzoate/H(+) symporter BenE family transporter n=1 Tax=Actinocorallia longicatena TaxID=111803 RepID=A0ABP6QIL1_9ACTN
MLSVTMGVAAIALGLRYRMPISTAWSTPGAALLVTVHGVAYRDALGAFAVTGVLIVLAGLSRHLGRALAAIPVPIASAMLAGVLLPLCVAPVKAVAEIPEAALPIVLTWAVLARFERTRRWSIPAALGVSAVAIVLTGSPGPLSWPSLTATVPHFSMGALAGVAIPLFVVTMASQNVPGMGVLAANGYRPPLRPILTTTGAGTVIGAPFGGHAINLAAITAALAASPDAHPDRDRRWIASVTGGVMYLFLGLTSGLAVTLLTSPLLIETVAGLALLAAFASSLHAAVQAPATRDEAVITFVVAASGITLLGIGAPFWGLVAGLAYRHTRPRPRPAPGKDDAASGDGVTASELSTELSTEQGTGSDGEKGGEVALRRN